MWSIYWKCVTDLDNSILVHTRDRVCRICLHRHMLRAQSCNSKNTSKVHTYSSVLSSAAASFLPASGAIKLSRELYLLQQAACHASFMNLKMSQTKLSSEQLGQWLPTVYYTYKSFVIYCQNIVTYFATCFSIKRPSSWLILIRELYHIYYNYAHPSGRAV